MNVKIKFVIHQPKMKHLYVIYVVFAIHLKLAVNNH